jgi:hypothetical protein
LVVIQFRVRGWLKRVGTRWKLGAENVIESAGVVGWEGVSVRDGMKELGDSGNIAESREEIPENEG